MWARSWPCTWWLRGPWRSIGRAYPQKRWQVSLINTTQDGEARHITMTSVHNDVLLCGPCTRVAHAGSPPACSIQGRHAAAMTCSPEHVLWRVQASERFS